MADLARFAEIVSQIAREVTRRQTSDVCCGDLTLEQFQTMRSANLAENATIGSLSAEQRVDLSTMSRNVSVLERNGYLLRARSEDDARVVHVRLSAKGRRALETLCCGEREVLQDVYERIPAAERPRVLKALEMLGSCLASDVAAKGCCLPYSGKGRARRDGR